MEWLGHSATVALKHYTRIPDELFERAARKGGADSGALVAQKAAHTAATTKRQDRTDLDEVLGLQAFSPILSDPVVSSLTVEMTPSGFEPEFWP